MITRFDQFGAIQTKLLPNFENMVPAIQTAIIEDQDPSSSRPLTVSTNVPVPALSTDYHVMVRVLAVALNPNDHKMATHFPMPGNTAGCDFCGVVVGVTPSTGSRMRQKYPAGTRVCGAVFPYRPNDKHNGAFAQFVVVDSRLLLKVPDHWSDLQGAALGGVGWSTVCLAVADPDALALVGTPSKPIQKPLPVLVYGGSTATGTLACQLLAR
jgi:NADPH:quinone reductase-like Zn-dependent oxidoreductase